MSLLEYVLTAEYFHCDLSSSSTLVVSSPNGLLSIIRSNKIEQIKFDLEAKNVKIYPNGDELFTTSDLDQGLRVWDLEAKKVVFSYPKDNIKYHIYTHNNAIAALLDSGVKFYDLRMRYSYGFHPCRGINYIDYDKTLYMITDLNIYTYQNNEKYLLFESSKKIKSFRPNVILTDDSLYFLNERICVKHSADKLLPLHTKYRNKNVIASTLNKNKIDRICCDQQFSECFETINTISHAISNEKSYYVFGDGKVYAAKL